MKKQLLKEIGRRLAIEGGNPYPASGHDWYPRDCCHDNDCAPVESIVRLVARALRRAQRDIDLRPELYTHYYRAEFPEHFHARMDTRRWGPGERIVFDTYTKEVFEDSFAWIAKREIFEAGKMGSGNYEEAVVSLATQQAPKSGDEGAGFG